MSDEPTVWVCIAVFNRIVYTRKCLDLLRGQTYPRIRTVVVDDGSRDGTSAMIAKEFPETILLEGDGSLFWTGAMHRGIAYIFRQAQAEDYVLLLNDDLCFGADLIARFIAQSRVHPRSLLQAVESCVDNPELIWQGGVRINRWTAKHTRLNEHRQRSEFPPGHFESSDYLTGRGVLVPCKVLRDIGNYDTSHKQYGDVELSRRAAKKGYQLKVLYDVVVLSYEKGKNFNETEAYSLGDVRRYYFGILSNFRLWIRWKQAIALTNSGAQALIFFAFDFVRITSHFLRRLRVTA